MGWKCRNETFKHWKHSCLKRTVSNFSSSMRTLFKRCCCSATDIICFCSLSLTIRSFLLAWLTYELTKNHENSRVSNLNWSHCTFNSTWSSAACAASSKGIAASTFTSQEPLTEEQNFSYERDDGFRFLKNLRHHCFPMLLRLMLSSLPLQRLKW